MSSLGQKNKIQDLADNLQNNNENIDPGLDENDEVNKSGSDFEVSTKTHKLKISFVGDSSVGKTSIISRFVKNIFDNEQGCTISAFYEKKKIKVDPFNEADLEIWDTAGQERYRSLTKSYLQNSKGVVIVFDLTREESFNNLKSWINELNEIVVDNEIEKILVGNKCDLPEPKISNEEINKFANEYNMQYLAVSAKEGINIESLFEILATNCIKNIKESQKRIEEEGLNNENKKDTSGIKIDANIENNKANNNQKFKDDSSKCS